MRTQLMTAVFALAFASGASSAGAVTYDAFSSFNGTQLAGNFIYGEANSATPNVSGTLFAANTNCFIAGSTCLQRLPNFDVPGVTKSTAPSFQYGSVNVPADRLLAHPGNDSNQTFLAFVAYRRDLYCQRDVQHSGRQSDWRWHQPHHNDDGRAPSDLFTAFAHQRKQSGL